MAVIKDKIVHSDGAALTLDEVKDKYSDVKNEITDFVKKNPLASVAIAAGVGFLLARLLSGRKE
ncbi:MAG: hypothetical protein H0V66_07040 [Bdellovibrionales bacterium]|nr:hypothetical protein [Bdellovibrionales bacterium]